MLLGQSINIIAQQTVQQAQKQRQNKAVELLQAEKKQRKVK